MIKATLSGMGSGTILKRTGSVDLVEKEKSNSTVSLNF